MTLGLNCNVTVDETVRMTEGGKQNPLSRVGWGLCRINEGCSGSGAGWASAVQYSGRQPSLPPFPTAKGGKRSMFRTPYRRDQMTQSKVEGGKQRDRSGWK